MMLFIYRQPLWRIGLLIILLPVLWAGLDYYSKRKHWYRIWRLLNAAGFLFMLSVILYVTVFKRSGGDYPVYLQPFRTFAAAKETPELYREMLMNVFLFVPLGLTFPYIWPDRMKAGWKYALSVLAAILLSAAVEYLQYSFSLGVAETDDVIMNGLGAIIGGGEVYIRLIGRKDRTDA